MDAGDRPDRTATGTGGPRASEAGSRIAWVVRGTAADPAADRAVTAALLDRAGAAGRPAIRAWVPDRQVAFGPRDAREPGYARACRVARRRGYRVVERRAGGRAVAYTGRTVAFARAVPVADPRTGLDDRYESVLGSALDALRSLDAAAAVERGEPPDAFCPGARSIRVRGGGKVAGVAQRVGADAALVAGCLLVDDRAAQRTILTPVYDALGLPFDPGAVGSLASGGSNAGAGGGVVAGAEGNGDGENDAPPSPTPTRVARALEAALVGGRPTRVEHAGRVAARHGAADPTGQS